MTDTAIRVENLSKRYRIGVKKDRHDTFMGSLIAAVKAPFANFRRLKRLSNFEESDDDLSILWALKCISFEVKHGEVIGIIGRNGAGKSTLLKILSRITEPTFGQVDIYGRFSSLLEVGTGFHPELTGRENIFLNGAVLGMSAAEIRKKFDEIVSFSGVERFLETPVKRYSSGMRVRLAFSVAAHLEPEILMIDEVLAVGDMEFQKKCIGKMGEVSRKGRTILFVSHSMPAIKALCSKAIWIDNGQIIAEGITQNVLEKYMVDCSRTGATDLSQRTDRSGRGDTRIQALWIENANGEKLDTVTCGQAICITAQYRSSSATPLSDPYIAFGIRSIMDERIADLWNESAGYYWRQIPEQGIVKCYIPKLPLNIGLYYISIWLRVNGIVEDSMERAALFSVVEGDFFGSGKLPNAKDGFALIEQRWEYHRNPSTADMTALSEDK